jgi:hypothetical protein
MFRITEDLSSVSLIQYLAKITRVVLPCPSTDTTEHKFISAMKVVINE